MWLHVPSSPACLETEIAEELSRAWLVLRAGEGLGYWEHTSDGDTLSPGVHMPGSPGVQSQLKATWQPSAYVCTFLGLGNNIRNGL